VSLGLQKCFHHPGLLLLLSLLVPSSNLLDLFRLHISLFFKLFHSVTLAMSTSAQQNQKDGLGRGKRTKKLTARVLGTTNPVSGHVTSLNQPQTTAPATT
jgi:hypothetical protein